MAATYLRNCVDWDYWWVWWQWVVYHCYLLCHHNLRRKTIIQLDAKNRMVFITPGRMNIVHPVWAGSPAVGCRVTQLYCVWLSPSCWCNSKFHTSAGEVGRIFLVVSNHQADLLFSSLMEFLNFDNTQLGMNYLRLDLLLEKNFRILSKGVGRFIWSLRDCWILSYSLRISFSWVWK